MIIAFAGMQKQAKTPKAVSDETVFGRFGFLGGEFLGGYERRPYRFIFYVVALWGNCALGKLDNR